MYRDLTFAVVIRTIGLCGTTTWFQSQGCYATVVIGSEQIHKTRVLENVGEPEWNDTFQL
jgi:hypothetical protein